MKSISYATFCQYLVRPSEVKIKPAKNTTIEATIEVLHIDDFDNHQNSKFLYTLITNNKELDFYPTEDLFEFHKEYATSNDTALGRRMLLLEEKNIDAIGAEIIEKVSTVSGFRPSGTHYMIYMFDTQEFNMGGCDKNLMYINLNNKDFSIDWFKRVFPHELNHQIYEETLPSANQDMVLWTILDEGLATYFENKINGSSVAESIFISEDELNWCIENEKDILIIRVLHEKMDLKNRIQE